MFVNPLGHLGGQIRIPRKKLHNLHQKSSKSELSGPISCQLSARGSLEGPPRVPGGTRLGKLRLSWVARPPRVYGDARMPLLRPLLVKTKVRTLIHIRPGTSHTTPQKGRTKIHAMPGISHAPLSTLSGLSPPPGGGFAAARGRNVSSKAG